jgi:Domain of unknown function (DUF6647)
MEALLTMIVVWLSANYDLPATKAHPKIKLVPRIEIALLRAGADTLEKRSAFITSYKKAAVQDNRLEVEVVATYDTGNSTILLSEGWTGSTPADLSVLVHEMVHHLQNAAQLSYECPAARETLAYAAQEKWLSLFGRSLLTEFEIDPLTLLVSTTCG